jgi:hypothetical protein
MFLRRAVPLPESFNICQDDSRDLNDMIASTESVVIRTQTPDHSVHESRALTQSSSRIYNILLVVSRPFKDDINSLLRARIIFDFLKTLSKVSSVNINVEIARSDT